MVVNKLYWKNKIWEVVGGSGNNIFIMGVLNEEIFWSEDYENFLLFEE